MKQLSKPTATTPSFDDAAKSLAVAARQQFLSAALTMGWQLALTILIPVIIGTRLDNHFHSSPLWTLISLVLAVLMAVLVVARTLRSFSVKQAAKPRNKST